MSAMHSSETLGIGLIGTGYMGKAHAFAYDAVTSFFPELPRPRLELLCDIDAEVARRTAAAHGFARSSDDWRQVVSDSAVALVSITTPNALHREIAVAALEAGKHVWCEKPMGLTLADAEAMTATARATGRATLLGYNYLRNPALRHAKALIEAGAIGRVFDLQGTIDEDYLADPTVPWSWRCRVADAGYGVLGDLGSHLIGLAHYLVGPITDVTATLETVHKERSLPDGSGLGPVENEDLVQALVRFEAGVGGRLTASRVAWGRKNGIRLEIHGTGGTILFDQERLNELRLYQAGERKETEGFRTILTGPQHPPYDRFWPAPGHSLGFGDLKIIELAHLLEAIAKGTPAYPAFEDGLQIERVIDAVARSAEIRGWVAVG